MPLDPSLPAPRRIARQGRVLTALVVAAVGLTMVTGGAADAKTKKPNDKAASVTEAATIQAAADANTREYTGTVEGTNAYIAVVASGQDVEVYLCDGGALSAWPQGKIAKDGTFEAEAAAKGIKVAGTITDSGAAGTVSLDGSDHAFTAPRATSPAGLYERLPAKDASGKVVVSATILLADGTQRGATAPSSSTTCSNILKSAKAYLAEWEANPNGAEAGANLTGYYNQKKNFASHGCGFASFSVS